MSLLLSVENEIIIQLKFNLMFDKMKMAKVIISNNASEVCKMFREYFLP